MFWLVNTHHVICLSKIFLTQLPPARDPNQQVVVKMYYAALTTLSFSSRSRLYFTMFNWLVRAGGEGGVVMQGVLLIITSFSKRSFSKINIIIQGGDNINSMMTWSLERQDHAFVCRILISIAIVRLTRHYLLLSWAHISNIFHTATHRQLEMRETMNCILLEQLKAWSIVTDEAALPRHRGCHNLQLPNKLNNTVVLFRYTRRNFYWQILQGFNEKFE